MANRSLSELGVELTGLDAKTTVYKLTRKHISKGAAYFKFCEIENRLKETLFQE